jgi:inositol transport system substrate-binding protein
LIICDTSGLYAAYNARQPDHRATVAAVDGDPGPLVVSPYVLTELDYLLRTRVGNESVARQAVEAMAAKAIGRFEGTGNKIRPLVLVGDLADPNAVQRRLGFMNVIEKYPDIFETPAEINTKWNSEVALAGLEAALTADPDIDFIFTSSDFLFPTIQGVLESKGKWKKAGEVGHVILGGLDGDDGACRLIREGYVDSTGVQDVYLEARLALESILAAIDSGDTRPNAIKLDPGFALSAENYDYRGAETWGCQVLDKG